MLKKEKVEEILKIIAKKPLENIKQMVDEVEKHFQKNSWSLEKNKQDLIKALQYLHDSEIPMGMGSFLDFMSGTIRKLPKLSDEVKEQIERLQNIIKNAKVTICEHKNLGIAPFLYGGGFTPIIVRPDLICLNCGLNVTLYTVHDKKYEEIFGLEIIDKDCFSKIFEWVGGEKEYGRNSLLKGVLDSDDLINDPKGIYEKSENKWMGSIPFKIVDKNLLESLSGL